ncbi:MAG: alanine--tRNA ligase [Clostridia bacterium]|nr:alanine--tRNA ligase [Clostridia bacterium]
MKWTGLNELREQYLSFFESKGHLRHESFPLVPQNDPSLLLINAGMAPLKPYFQGTKEPPRRRMVTCQKCIRTPDIERVGKTARHGTYFEMLGNFSFGDYFKEEAITWAWEFCTKILELPADRLWPSIYEKDDEAYDIWVNKVGVPKEHIVRLGKEDNFWELATGGPCGPCSEIYFDRGEKYGCGSPDCKPGCDCDRFMEIWNNVFSQFEGDGKGNYTELAHKNIDTGMGLERLACVMQGVDNLFEVDTVRKILDEVCKISGKNYGDNAESDISIRVITDHIRSTTFMICDGVVPSNEGRGYVLRRLLRRAARHGKLLGIDKTFLYELCDVVIGENKTAYPELVDKKDYIKKVIEIEEQRFNTTIDAGLNILETIIDSARKEGKNILSGEDTFKLYDTFGFPIDLTREIAEENNLKIDEDTFNSLMNEQKVRARNARAATGWNETSKNILEKYPATVFEGYTSLESDGKILAIVCNDALCDQVSEGDFSLLLDKTSFYGEGGGQVGDTGIITTSTAQINVVDTKKSADGKYLHICEIINGSVSVGDCVNTKVDSERRSAIMRNHSAAHLLQAALRKVLGNHVEQAGSYVDAERVRFDFSHFQAVTHEELMKIETLVNSFILAGAKIETVETDVETAKKNGAMALFGEKYGKTVRMVKMGSFSTELCGGTHLDNTSKAGLFKIISESSVAAGVRRIEGTTGTNVLDLYYAENDLILATAKLLKANNPSEIAKKAELLQNEIHDLKKTIEELNSKIAASETAKIEEKIKAIGAYKALFCEMPGMAPDALRAAGDKLKDKYADIVAVLYTAQPGKVSLAAVCGKDAVKTGANAGTILKTISPILGGGGGGRPDSAFSGGKDISKIADAEKAFFELLK